MYRMDSNASRRVPLFLLCAVGGLLAACDEGEGVFPSKSLVYESSGKLQCQQNGLTPQQSAARLAGAGIKVLASSCGVVTGVAFPTVCGAPTSEILLHEVPLSDLEAADRLGFKTADSLRKDSDHSYARVDCQTGAVLP
jgi:hypothetical protein